MSDLAAQFLRNGGNLTHKWLHYFDIYERHFARFRGTSPVMLEIGVGGGGSLEMWRTYFGQGAKIIGLDINENAKQFGGDNVEIVIGAQSDQAVLTEILTRYPRIDVVLDDGSHRMTDLQATFAFLYPRISPTGCYMVEDLHTCYWPGFGGGLKREGTFIEIVKGLIDELNAPHTLNAVPVSDFTRSTDSISVYDSVVVLEKRPQGRRQHLQTAGMP